MQDKKKNVASLSKEVPPLGVSYQCFPILESVEFEGKRFRLGSSALTVLKLLLQLYETNPKLTFASLRATLRQVKRSNVQEKDGRGVRHLLLILIRLTILEDRRRLFIWLLGHLKGQTGNRLLIKFKSHPEWRTRKEVVRTLRKIEAWRELRQFEQFDPMGRIRRLAKPVEIFSLEKRLEIFCRNVKPLPAVPKRRSLFISPGVSLRRIGTKPISVIRKCLLKIRHILAGRS